MQLQPYLSFEGRCDEAIEFYRGALGAEVKMLMRFKDNPEPREGCGPSGAALEKVMHAELRFGAATLLMSDGQNRGATAFEGIFLTLITASETEAKDRFNSLAVGGTVMQPLQRTFFSPCFGMLKDKFGVCWMLLTQDAK